MKKKEAVYIIKKIDLDYIGDDKYIYKVEDVKTGGIESGVFFDDDGNRYQNVKDPKFNLSKEEIGYYKTPAFDKMYISEKTQAMKRSVKSLLLVGDYNSFEEMVDIYEIDITKLPVKDFFRYIGVEKNENYCRIPVKLFLSYVDSNDMDKIRELTEIIKENRYGGNNIDISIEGEKEDGMDYIRISIDDYLNIVNPNNINSIKDLASNIKSNYTKGEDITVGLEEDYEKNQRKKLSQKRKLVNNET